MSSCVCEGTNENCRYCQGTGQSGVQLPVRSLCIDLTSTQRIGSRHKSRGGCCPICGKTSSKLGRHLRNFHPEASSLLLPEPGTTKARQQTGENSRPGSSQSRLQESMTPTRLLATVPTPMKNCPLCNHEVREDRMQKHLDFRCSLRPGKPQRHKPRMMQLAVVPHGIAEVFQRLSSSKNAPPSKLGTRGASPKDSGRKPKHSTGDASSESARNTGKVGVERPEWWDNLDATKNCGYPAREEGRYGSYPSHDGFDDESKP